MFPSSLDVNGFPSFTLASSVFTLFYYLLCVMCSKNVSLMSAFVLALACNGDNSLIIGIMQSVLVD